MLKPELNNLPSEFCENIDSSEMYVFQFISYLFILSLIHLFFIFLNDLEAIGSFILFFIRQGLLKKYSRALPKWANQSFFFVSKVSDSFDIEGTLNFLPYFTRNIGYKVSFHNKVVVPFGYGNKRSLSVFPFKCVYSHFGVP